MPSLRTALVLTLSAAAAAIVPAGAAHAATSLPGAGIAGALPTSALGDALPTSAIGEALPTQSVAGALGSGVSPVKNLTLDPLSHTGTDPLDNAVGSQVADFKPVSTAAATGPITSGGSLSTLPLVGTVAGLLPG